MTYLLGVGLAVYTMYFAYTFHVQRSRFANVFLGVGLAIYFLREYLGSDASARLLTSETQGSEVSGFGRSGIPDRWAELPYVNLLNSVVCLSFAVLAILTSAYVELNFERHLHHAPVAGYTTTDLVVGGIVIILTLEATRRAFGMIITGVILLCMGFALAGPYLPGIFFHSGMSVPFLVENVAAGPGAGVYGFILQVGTTWIAIFLIFAGIAKVFGAMDYMRRLSFEIRKKFKTGFVMPAVTASMFMGSLTGASAANVATTGSFTIPLMKEQGIDSRYAAAIESLASTGGQMLPPVMGTAAFLMADILGVPFVEIMRAGILPALLFYFAVSVTVTLLVYKHGWIVTETAAFDYRIVIGGLKFFIPLGVIIYLLAVIRATPLTAGFWAILTIIGIEFLTRAIEPGSISEHRDLGSVINPVVETTKRTIDALNQGLVEMAPLIGILATIGIIIETLNRTGFSQRLSTYIVALGGATLLVMLFIAMFSSILFGLGMPTPAAYIVVAILVAPALVNVGVEPLTAHMFVFYYAMLSAITPPVALAVVVASRIADADFIKTAIITGIAGIAAMCVPFIFVYNSSLILWASPTTAVDLAFAIIGIVVISLVSTGYLNGELLSYVGRIVFAVGALVMLFYPGTIVRVAAVVIIALLAAGSHPQSIRLPLIFHRGTD